MLYLYIYIQDHCVIQKERSSKFKDKKHYRNILLIATQKQDKDLN